MQLRPALTWLTWALLGLLVLAIAGVTHVVSVLTLPWRSPNDAFSRVATQTASSGRATLLATDEAAPPLTDPAMLTQVCGFDLRIAPFRLTLSPLADEFVTIGFHSRHGIAFYGLTVRASDATGFDLVLAAKKDDAAASTPDGDAKTVTVIAPEPDGFVTLSTPLGGRSERDLAEDRIAKVACRSDAS